MVIALYLGFSILLGMEGKLKYYYFSLLQPILARFYNGVKGEFGISPYLSLHFRHFQPRGILLRMSKKRKIRPKKINKYDNLSKPEAEFDFHDRGPLRESDVKKLADEFLDECKHRKLTKVLFITGKGLRSKNGMPVIKPFLRKYLGGLPFVLRVYEGRSDRGGAGTLEVHLVFTIEKTS